MKNFSVSSSLLEFIYTHRSNSHGIDGRRYHAIIILGGLFIFRWNEALEEGE